MHRFITSAVLALTLAGASAADAQSINQNFTMTCGAGLAQQTSAMPAALGTGFAWQINITSLIANGTIFGQPVPLPLTSYGLNIADTMASGIYSGSLAGTMWSHRFTFTDTGAVAPTYDFTVSLLLNSDRTTSVQLAILGLHSFTAGGITDSPAVIPVQSITAGGNVIVSPLIPGPGPAALFGVGSLLLSRRRRH